MKLLGTIFTLFTLLIFLIYPKFTLAQVKKVEVDLTNQRLYAFQNNQVMYNFPISSGKWALTPTGTFYPYYKTLSTRMTGGNPAIGTFYDLPNVPYDVFFYQGYALHGTYWHSNFGHPMSHGCINMQTDQAQLIYNWIDYSTPISIYGVTPRS